MDSLVARPPVCRIPHLMSTIAAERTCRPESVTEPNVCDRLYSRGLHVIRFLGSVPFPLGLNFEYSRERGCRTSCLHLRFGSPLTPEAAVPEHGWARCVQSGNGLQCDAGCADVPCQQPRCALLPAGLGWGGSESCPAVCHDHSQTSFPRPLTETCSGPCSVSSLQVALI